MSPEEIATLHAEGQADAEQFGLDLYYAGTLMHSGRERDGLELFRGASRQARASGDRGRVLTASLGVAYANWLAGSLSEAVATIDHALRLAGGNPTTGAGLAFVCPLAHAFGHRGQCLGYMGELETARQDFDRAIELAREHDDPETESDTHANLALLEADVGEVEAALAAAAVSLAIAERMSNTIGILVADRARCRGGGRGTLRRRAGAGRVHPRDDPRASHRPATTSRCSSPRSHDASSRSASRRRARGRRGGAPDHERAWPHHRARCRAPITLAHVLIATQGAAAGERVELILSRALQLARACGAHIFEPKINDELAALAGLRGASGERSRN